MTASRDKIAGRRALADVDQSRKAANRAFARVELVALVGAFALLASVVLPALANTSFGSDRAICFNNLRLIGRAMQTWCGYTNTRQPPWWTPVADGGTYQPSRPANAWFEFMVLSNELVTPKVLACPSDIGVVPQSEWHRFVLPGARQSAVSYVIGLHARTDAPRAWLSGDRNLRSDLYTSCEVGLQNVSGIPIEAGWWRGWTNGAVHGDRGHILLNDGSVEFTSSGRARELLFAPEGDPVSPNMRHFLKAR